MIIGLLREPIHETRVSLLPEHLGGLRKAGAELWVEQGAGILSFASDQQYADAGATVCSRNELLQKADILLSIHPPQTSELQSCSGKVLLGVFQPLFNAKLMEDWAKMGMTVFSMDMLPRTTRAQSMDVLSSQANIAGYKAVILAADIFPRYFPMFMTAAGTVPPAKVLILGAGVAGLQAIATARRLGAVVEVFDTRPAVKEEVMSLGARFIEVEGAADASKAGGYAVEQSAEFMARQQAKIAEAVAKADIVISTAQIPGKKAPILITQKMIDAMRAGSVIIDLAAATGGNTELTKNGERVQYHGICIVGDSALPSRQPADASKMYGKNILNFLPLIIQKDKGFVMNMDDDLVKGSCMAHAGLVCNERVSALLSI